MGGTLLWSRPCAPCLYDVVDMPRADRSCCSSSSDGAIWNRAERVVDGLARSRVVPLVARRGGTGTVQHGEGRRAMSLSAVTSHTGTRQCDPRLAIVDDHNHHGSIPSPGGTARRSAAGSITTSGARRCVTRPHRASRGRQSFPCTQARGSLEVERYNNDNDNDNVQTARRMAPRRASRALRGRAGLPVPGAKRGVTGPVPDRSLAVTKRCVRSTRYLGARPLPSVSWRTWNLPRAASSPSPHRTPPYQQYCVRPPFPVRPVSHAAPAFRPLPSDLRSTAWPRRPLLLSSSSPSFSLPISSSPPRLPIPFSPSPLYLTCFFPLSLSLSLSLSLWLAHSLPLLPLCPDTFLSASPACRCVSDSPVQSLIVLPSRPPARSVGVRHPRPYQLPVAPL
ncbi:hypothetical protein VTN02DRAFT_6044 [Thermoascus thermophilus]